MVAVDDAPSAPPHGQAEPKRDGCQDVPRVVTVDIDIDIVRGRGVVTALCAKQGLEAVLGPQPVAAIVRRRATQPPSSSSSSTGFFVPTS